jgi:hypothetical protein
VDGSPSTPLEPQSKLNMETTILSGSQEAALGDSLALKVPIRTTGIQDNVREDPRWRAPKQHRGHARRKNQKQTAREASERILGVFTLLSEANRGFIESARFGISHTNMRDAVCRCGAGPRPAEALTTRRVAERDVWNPR